MVPRYNDNSSFAKCLHRGKEESKFVLVNIQDPNEFMSHTLNRDVWSNETVEEMLKASFIFWQRDDTHPEGKQFLQYFQFVGGLFIKSS